MFIKAFKQLIASPDNWNGEECVSYKVTCLLLFINHNISIINIERDENMRKLFALSWSVQKTITTRGVYLTGVFTLDFTIRHFSDYSDLLDKLKNTLLARSLEEHGGIQHEKSIIPAFNE